MSMGSLNHDGASPNEAPLIGKLLEPIGVSVLGGIEVQDLIQLTTCKVLRKPLLSLASQCPPQPYLLLAYTSCCPQASAESAHYSSKTTDTSGVGVGEEGRLLVAQLEHRICPV
jgi:hypothetical protein